jgi:hypothetical protein
LTDLGIGNLGICLEPKILGASDTYKNIFVDLTVIAVGKERILILRF